MGGFCRYPASTIHVSSRYCVQRIPDKTCHVTRVCYSGGLTTSFCEKGLCMCKFGYKYEGEGDDATCVEASEMLLAANTTEDLAFIKQQIPSTSPRKRCILSTLGMRVRCQLFRRHSLEAR